MESIVSTPDPGDSHRPQNNGHRAGLVVDDLHRYDPTDEPADGAVGESDFESGRDTGVEVTPELVAEQTAILEQELAALLEEQSCNAELADTDSETTDPGQPKASATPLPGFEALTSADLAICPDWCIHQDLPVHSDGFDQAPDDAPHRGVEHGIHPIHGGASIDHAGSAGRADVTVQLEQERDQSTGPVVTLSVVVRGIEQYAWLSLPETRALHSLLEHLLREAGTT